MVEMLEKVAEFPEPSLMRDVYPQSALYVRKDAFGMPEDPVATVEDSWIGVVPIDKFDFHCRLLYEAGYTNTWESTAWIKSLTTYHPVPNEPVSITWAGLQFLQGIKEHGGYKKYLTVLSDYAIKNGVSLIGLAQNLI